MRLTLIGLCVFSLAAFQPAPPELFGEGVISTPDYELNAAFLPDGKTLFFTKSTANMGFWTIVASHLVNGRWTEPEVVPLSGRYPDTDLCVTPAAISAVRPPAIPWRENESLFPSRDRRSHRMLHPRPLPAPARITASSSPSCKASSTPVRAKSRTPMSAIRA